MEPEYPFSLVFPLPDERHAMEADIPSLLTAMALLKLAGQLVIPVEDISHLCHEYVGFTVLYSPEHKHFVAKLCTRK